MRLCGGLEGSVGARVNKLGRYRWDTGRTPHVSWSLRHRTCLRFGHKSAFPCSRCGVRDDSATSAVGACVEAEIIPGVVEWIFRPDPVLAYLKRAR